MKETREENRRLKQEIEILNQRVKQMGDNNDDLASKLEASENNIISLERQLLDINLLQAHQREENRQDLLLSGVKVISGYVIRCTIMPSSFFFVCIIFSLDKI